MVFYAFCQGKYYKMNKISHYGLWVLFGFIPTLDYRDKVLVVPRF